jgi:hypothetical protein
MLVIQGLQREMDWVALAHILDDIKPKVRILSGFLNLSSFQPQPESAIASSESLDFDEPGRTLNVGCCSPIASVGWLPARSSLPFHYPGDRSILYAFVAGYYFWRVAGCRHQLTPGT